MHRVYTLGKEDGKTKYDDDDDDQRRRPERCQESIKLTVLTKEGQGMLWANPSQDGGFSPDRRRESTKLSSLGRHEAAHDARITCYTVTTPYSTALSGCG